MMIVVILIGVILVVVILIVGITIVIENNVNMYFYVVRVLDDLFYFV